MEKPEPLTLEEMAARAAAKSASLYRLACPRCGCSDFRTYKTIRGQSATFRYKACRHCGHKLLTTQPAERAIRDVGAEVEQPKDTSSLFDEFDDDE